MSTCGIKYCGVTFLRMFLQLGHDFPETPVSVRHGKARPSVEKPHIQRPFCIQQPRKFWGRMAATEDAVSCVCNRKRVCLKKMMHSKDRTRSNLKKKKSVWPQSKLVDIFFLLLQLLRPSLRLNICSLLFSASHSVTHSWLYCLWPYWCSWMSAYEVVYTALMNKHGIKEKSTRVFFPPYGLV